ncbi:MAG: hypothetical protein ABIQ35_11245 [Verrucomicrobiota bacterium]
MSKSISHVKHLRKQEGVFAINVLRLGADVPDGNTVTIGSRVYECDDQAKTNIASGRVRVSIFNGYANATLNFNQSQNVADGNTVTVRAKTYTFRAALTNVDGYVKIGATIARSIYNLVAAMNVGNDDLYGPPNNYGALNDAGEGAGVDYAAAMTQNAAGIESGYGGDFDLQIAHRAGGAVGSTVALAATLVGGASWAEGNFLSNVPHPTADQFATSVAAAFNSDPDGPVWAEKISGTEVLVWSRRDGDVRLTCSSAFSSGSNFWESATLMGGIGEREGLMLVGAVRRVATATEATLGRLHAAFGFEPTGALVRWTNAAGVTLPFDGSIVLSGRRATITKGATLFVAGQIFHLLVFK